jgi:hypothetical protein
MKTFFILIMAILFSNILVAQSFSAARIMAMNDITALGYRYDGKRNIYYSNDETIHIFIYEDGNLLVAGYPTTATEKSKYQVHLYVNSSNRSNYLLEYTGSYVPTLNIQNKNEVAAAAPTIVRVDFAIIGPFTSNLVLTIKKETNPGTYQTLSSTTIQISKTIHASIGSGLIYSSLRDPENIRKVPYSGSDSTLVADDINGRGLLTLMATFYPWGRNNLMLNSNRFKDRFGIVIGTSIGSGTSNFKNFFLGAQYDFSIGGSIVAGLHYGRRQKITGLDYNEFEFGKTIFTGNLEDKKYMQWDPGFFIGLQVDSRIFSQIFK